MNVRLMIETIIGKFRLKIERCEMEYFVLVANEPTLLAEKANKVMADGWKLQGGVSCVSVTLGDNPVQFYQAIVRDLT